MDITNDYKDLIPSMAKFFNKSIRDIKVIEISDEEIICNQAGEKLLSVDEFFRLENDSSVNEFKEPTEYFKIIFYDEPENAFSKAFGVNHSSNNFYDFRDAYFVKHNDRGSFVVVYAPYSPSCVGQIFHWSSLCGLYDEIIPFIEEKEFFKSTEIN